MGIAVGPDGALWFTEEIAEKIGRVTTAGAVSEFPNPQYLTSPWAIAAGPDGAMWFTDQLNAIGRITPAGQIGRFALSHGSGPKGIVAGPDGAMWLSLIHI